MFPSPLVAEIDNLLCETSHTPRLHRETLSYGTDAKLPVGSGTSSK